MSFDFNEIFLQQSAAKRQMRSSTNKVNIFEISILSVHHEAASSLVSEKNKFIRQGRMGDNGGTASDARHLPPTHRRLLIARALLPHRC